MVHVNLFMKQKQTHRLKKNLWLHKGKHGGGVENKLGAWYLHAHSTIYKIDNQQEPTV